MYDSLATIRPGDPDVIVVGGGIAGLSAALSASRAGARTLVLDAHGLGGRARTTEHDGFELNVGPHALYRGGHLRGLLDRHGITVTGGRPDERIRLLRDGTLTPLHMRVADIMRTPLLGRRDRVRLLGLLASVQRHRPDALVGRTVDEWLGDQPLAVRQFVDMLVRVSSYTNAPASFDAGAALQQIQMALTAGVDYLDHGWGAMAEAMIRVIRGRGGEVVGGATVTAVVGDGSSVEVHLDDLVLRSRAAVVAAGGPALAERLTGARPAGASGLTAPVQAATLDLSLRRPHAGLVFGLDRPLYLSPHAPAARLAPDGCGLVTLVQYVPAEAPASDGRGSGDRDADRHELRALARLAGIDDADVIHERYSHRLVVNHGSPTAA
ncbi:MAG: NAD(P)-binding protein, partial [Actinobacteria bacterium]|nr:NAD(P)-binding protein [Actinomycetota bacterium]